MRRSAETAPHEKLQLAYECWSAPEGIAKLYLRTHLLQGLAAEIHGVSSSEQAGLLLGSNQSETPTISVSDYQAFQFSVQEGVSERANELAGQMSQWQHQTPGAIYPVGYYRCRPAGGAALDELDKALMLSGHWSGLRIYLAVEVNSERAVTYSAHLWQNKSIPGDSECIRIGARSSPAFCPDERPTLLNEATPVVTARPEQPIRSALSFAASLPMMWRFWHWWLVVGLLGILAGSAWVGFARWPKAKLPAVVLEAGAKSTLGLGLQIERHNFDLRLSWDRRSPLIREAHGAVLSIQESGMHHAVAINLEQLRTGSVLYSTTSPDVNLELQVVGADEQITRESVRVMAGLLNRIEPEHGASANRLEVLTQALRSPLTVARSQREPPPMTVLPPSTANKALMQSEAFKPLATTKPEPLAAQSSTAANGLLQPSSPAAVSLPEAVVSPEVAVSTAANQRIVNTSSPSGIPQLSGAVASLLKAELPRSGMSPIKEPKSNAENVLSSKAEDDLNYISATPIKQIKPVVPPAARIFQRSYPVKVGILVHIDEYGKVTRAERLPGEMPVTGLLVAAATNAATLWQFSPAQIHGQRVPSQMTIYFQFFGRADK